MPDAGGPPMTVASSVRPSVLLLLTVAFGAAALAIYPAEPTLSMQANVLAVTASTSDTPLALRIYEGPTGRNGTELWLDLRLDPAPEIAANDVVFFDVTVSDRTWGSRTACDRTAYRCLDDGEGKKTVVYSSPVTTKGDIRAAGVHERVPASGRIGYGVVSDALSALVGLPSAGVSARRRQVVVPVTTAVTFRSSGRYQWDSNSQASTDGAWLSWTDETSATAGARVERGTDPDRQDANVRATFISGALLGVAGGALIGAVTEGIAPVQRMLSRRSGETSASDAERSRLERRIRVRRALRARR